MKTEVEINTQSASNSPSPTPARRRINSIDLLRGIVMVIMMLDHTRDFSHGDSLNFDPTDLSKTSVAIFLTRWITHYCAPIFVFLAGTSAYLQTARGKSKAELSKFLVTRGLWLVLLELTVDRIIIWFNLDYHFVFMLQVIWAIGVSMIVLAALIHLPLRAIAIFSVAMITLHNLLDPITVNPGNATPSVWQAVWMLLHQAGPIFFKPNVYGLVLYPLIPWIGVLSAGYVFGTVYKWESERRRRFLFMFGSALVVGFLVIRGINRYGDPLHWSVQKNAIFTVLSFLNTLKYPPSLLYLLMTLGPAIIALGWFEKAEQGTLSSIFITFGRVPLFFYIGQWITAHTLAVVVSYLVGKPTAWLFVGFLDLPNPNPGNLGFSLWVVYAFWIAGLLILYPLCRWFAEVKRRRNDWWLSYL